MREKTKKTLFLFEYSDSKRRVRLEKKCESSEKSQPSNSHLMSDARCLRSLDWEMAERIVTILKLLGNFSQLIPFIREIVLRHIFYTQRGINRIGFLYMQAV